MFCLSLAATTSRPSRPNVCRYKTTSKILLLFVKSLLALFPQLLHLQKQNFRSLLCPQICSTLPGHPISVTIARLSSLPLVQCPILMTKMTYTTLNFWQTRVSSSPPTHVVASHLSPHVFYHSWWPQCRPCRVFEEGTNSGSSSHGIPSFVSGYFLSRRFLILVQRFCQWKFFLHGLSRMLLSVF